MHHMLDAAHAAAFNKPPHGIGTNAARADLEENSVRTRAGAAAVPAAPAAPEPPLAAFDCKVDVCSRRTHALFNAHPPSKAPARGARPQRQPSAQACSAIPPGTCASPPGRPPTCPATAHRGGGVLVSTVKSQGPAERLKITGEDRSIGWCRGSPAKIQSVPPGEPTKDLYQRIHLLGYLVWQNWPRGMRPGQTARAAAGRITGQ
jgi:hypothetical protein